MSYIKYITHVTDLDYLDDILKTGLKSTNIQREYEDIQCVWFNYIGIYNNQPFYSDMTSGSDFVGKIMINIDFNKFLLDMYNQQNLPYEERYRLPREELVSSSFYTGIGIYDASLRYDIYSEYDDTDIYEVSLNAQNVDDEDEDDVRNEFLYGLSKLDNKLPVEIFDKLKNNWNRIVKDGQELVVYGQSRSPFVLNIKNYISSIIIYNESVYSRLREMLDLNGMSLIPIHLSNYRSYKSNLENKEPTTENIKTLCKNVKQLHGKSKIEEMATKYGITMPGTTKAELCMNLYMQLLMNP
jgi:hypothetical protein